MSLSDLYNIKRTIAKDKGFGPPTFVPTQAGVAKKCGFCHLNQSNYICPTCNAPYCSLKCFRSEPHKACSSPFAERSARDSADPEQIVADDEERKRMMDILKRLEESGMEGGIDENVADGNQDGEAEVMDLPDLDRASTEELLSYLSPLDRARFENALKHPDRAQALVEQLFGKPNSMSSETVRSSQAEEDDSEGAEESTKRRSLLQPGPASSAQPWWTGENNRRPSKYQEFHLSALERFKGSLLPLLETPPTASAAGSSHAVSHPPKRLNLAFNIIALLLSYAYILRHLGLERLSDLMPRDNSSQEPIRSENLNSLGKTKPGVDDDEMPPLEPDTDESMPLPILPSQARGDAAGLNELKNVSQSPSSKAQQEVEFERAEQLSIALSMFSSLSPFLSPPQKSKGRSSSHPVHSGNYLLAGEETEDFSRVLLTSTQDASLFFLARLNSLPSERSKGGISNAAELLSFLLRDVKKIMQENKVVELSSNSDPDRQGTENIPKEILENFKTRENSLKALADVFTLFSQVDTSQKKRPNPIQAKLLFYAKFLLSLSAGSMPTVEDQRTWKNQHSKASLETLKNDVARRGEFDRILKGKEGIDQELERLAIEVERDEDEKRWKAAERATRNGDGGQRIDKALVLE